MNAAPRFAVGDEVEIRDDGHPSFNPNHLGETGIVVYAEQLLSGKPVYHVTLDGAAVAILFEDELAAVPQLTAAPG